jgi:hypothetical protein
MATTVTPYQPKSIAEGQQLSVMLCKSGMVPRQFQGRPMDAFVAMAHGAEVGLGPMASLQHIAVINGRPGLYGDAIAGVALKSGAIRAIDEHLEGEPMADGWTAVAVVTRPDGGKVERRFSVVDAKRAGLWGKSGPWQQYPQRMLAARARGYAIRDAAPHAFLGYTVEELRDLAEDERKHLKDVTPGAGQGRSPDPSRTEPAAEPAQHEPPVVDVRPEEPLLEVIQIVGHDGKPVYVGNVWQEALRFYGAAKRASTDATAVALANLTALRTILPYAKNGTRGRLLAEIEALEAMQDGEILERPGRCSDHTGAEETPPPDSEEAA